MGGTNIMIKETPSAMKGGEEMMMMMDIIIALIEATSMNIMLMHRALNLGILTLLVTHPLLKMIVIIIKNAPTLRTTTTSALAHLILIIGIPTKMKD